MSMPTLQEDGVHHYSYGHGTLLNVLFEELNCSSRLLETVEQMSEGGAIATFGGCRKVLERVPVVPMCFQQSPQKRQAMHQRQPHLLLLLLGTVVQGA